MSAQPFRLALLAQALAYANKGVREEGGVNRGPDVSHFLRSVGAQDGDPWCAAFTSCCALESAMKRKLPQGDFQWARKWLNDNFFKPSASVMEIVLDAQKRGTWRAADWTPKPGSLVCYSFPTGHHIGVFQRMSGVRLTVIEGNTSSDAGSQRDGDGVFIRQRPTTYVMGYVDLGDS